MSLASVIRLEFAYPGVGILAGDSLQYLSIATAHGVIMVFFMIMPAIFGAFGNFLLPTQLGVHDVAFPRLNSAAFWFLPGGLIMLMQLVCVDRRYQRMNCFNIRELQGILKRKFFTDLVNTNDHRDFLNQSMIGLRFKTNNHLAITPDLESFFNLGTINTTKAKTLNFTNFYNSPKLNFSGSSVENFFNFSYFTNIVYTLFTSVFTIFMSLNPQSLLSMNYIFLNLNKVFNSNFIFLKSLPLYSRNNALSIKSSDVNNDVTFTVENVQNTTLTLCLSP
jgi:hypothetical protein